MFKTNFYTLNLMRIIKIAFLLIGIILLTSCASGYRTIEPKTINYISNNESQDVKLEYKYDLLRRKYAKKELKKGVKLVAIKISNNSDRDLMIGDDIRLTYGSGIDVVVMDPNQVFVKLKQSPASYLFYLLLSPLNFYTTETDSYGRQEQTSSTPVGLILGPGLAMGNMVAAGSANKKFKKEMLDYNIYGTVVKKGETVYGLIGMRSRSYEALQLKIKE